MKIIPGVIIILTGLMIYTLYLIHKKKFNIRWPIAIFRLFFPLFSYGLFGPTFLFLVTLFYCQEGHSYVSTELKCREGSLFIYHLPFVILAIIFLCVISYLTNTLYYVHLFFTNHSDLLKKLNTIPDIVLLITKIFMIMLFILKNQ